MLKQVQVDHYRFQHQLTGKMSCGWKHEAFGAGVSKIIRPKHSHWKRCNINKWFWGTQTTLHFLASGHHTTWATDSSRDQSNCPEQGLDDHSTCSTYILQRGQQYSSLSYQTRRQQDNKAHYREPRNMNQNGKRSVAVVCDSRTRSHGKYPRIGSNASKAAGREEAIRWGVRKGSKAQ